MTTLLKTALRARHFFPLAPRDVCARQAVAYAKAVRYLNERNLSAAAVDSKFVYQPMLHKPT